MTDRRPDRVVIINDRSAKVGGASNLAILSADLLARAGIAVTYFAGDTSSDERPAADTIHLGGETLLQQSKLSALATGLYNKKAFSALSELIDQGDTHSTIYHVHGWSKILSPSIFRALQGVRQRVVLHAHDYFLSCPNGGFANYRTNEVCKLSPMSMACLTTQCDKRGYHEKVWRSARHMLREQLFPVRQMPANIVIVHQRMRDYFVRAGVHTKDIETIANPAEALLSMPASPWQNHDFFFIGRLEPEKGFEDAARAARLAGVRLRVIGDGAGRGLLEEKYPECIVHGWKTKDEIRKLVGDARAVIISSRVPEPFGLVAVEAIGSGIPVIMPDAALLATDVAQRDCGLTFHTGNTQSLAAAITRLIGDDDLIRRMSANCLRTAGSLAHSPDAWGQALLGLYGRVLTRADKGTVRTLHTANAQAVA
jgi:glycosyltransferase involved in cell wall biosynthesis